MTAALSIAPIQCPGDMMATNPRWCQPLRVWREYFAGWVAQPDLTAQMLAMDTRTLAVHPSSKDLRLAQVYGFARWRGSPMPAS